MAKDDQTPAPQLPEEPQSVEDFVRRAWILHVKGEHQRAEADFRQALSMDPQSVEATYGLGMSLKVQGREDEAVRTFQHTVELLDHGHLKEDIARATMLRHLSQAHVNLIQKGMNLEAKK